VPSEPGRVWSASVDYIYPDLRPETRTVRVRLRLPNADRVFRANMFAAVHLTAQPRPAVLVIPVEALIRSGSGDRVVLALDGGRFKPVPVKAGISVGGQVEIVEGLDEGDRVVASAQFLFDSESSLAGGLRRMDMPAVSSAAEAPTSALIWTDAAVNAAPADGMVNLTHPPIPAIGWPAMTMDFAVDPGLVAALVPGRKLRIGLVRDPDGTYRVTTVEKVAP
jgi:Cu(I)/Ag(I) efflux system membrane fusion protein